jgi:hypothetical protein
VTLQALVVEGLSGFESPLSSVAFFGRMDFVTATALDALRSMGARKPVPHMLRFRVTAQASAIGFVGRAVFEADDLVFRLFGIAAGFLVEATRTVTLLTVHVTKCMGAVPEGLCEVGVTLRTLICAHLRGSGNFKILVEILVLFIARFWFGSSRDRD